MSVWCCRARRARRMREGRAGCTGAVGLAGRARCARDVQGAEGRQACFAGGEGARHVSPESRRSTVRPASVHRVGSAGWVTAVTNDNDASCINSGDRRAHGTLQRVRRRVMTSSSGVQDDGRRQGVSRLRGGMLALILTCVVPSAAESRGCYERGVR